jgi:hypothetical protein
MERFIEAMISLNPAKYLRFAARIIKYSRRIKGRTSLSLMQQGLEAYRLLRLNRLEPTEYYETYELFRDDLSWEEKTAYLSRNQFAILDGRLNPKKNVGVLNKLVFKIFAQKFGLPVAKMYGLFDTHFGYTSGGEKLSTCEELERFLDNPEMKEFLFKPISADKAQGIIICGKEAGKLVELGVGEIDIKTLYQRLCDSHHSGFKHVADSWLVEERVRPHPWFDRYSSTYTHHYRIVTFLTSTGEVEYLGASMGIGISGSYLHRSGLLGLGSGFSDDGALTAAVRTGPKGIEYLDNHPETGERITGEHPPGYDEAIKLARKAHTYFPHLRAIGWDIAPTEGGLVIFEANHYWNWEKFQRANRRGLIKGSLAKELPEILAQDN